MIGGLRLAVDATGLGLPMQVSGPAARFVTPWEDTPADAAIRVGWLDEAVPLPEPTELLFASGGMWTLYRAAGGYRYDIATPVFGPEPYRIAWFDPAYQPAMSGIAACRPSSPPCSRRWNIPWMNCW